MDMRGHYLETIRPLNNWHLAEDWRAVNARAAAQKMFAGIRVPGNNLVQLILRRPQMIADQFSEHRPIINGPLQIPAARAEHGAVLSGGRGGGKPAKAGDPVVRIAGAATEHAKSVALAVALDAAAGDEHHAALGMVRAGRAVLHGGAPKFRERHDHDIVPAHLRARSRVRPAFAVNHEKLS